MVEETSEPEPSAEPKEDDVTEKKMTNREKASITVAEDLELWQQKFAQVADEGAAEIEERVDEIAAHMIANEANGMGRTLVKQLDDTVQDELKKLKEAIIAAVEIHGDDTDKVNEDVTAAVRGAGIPIKDKATEIREWRQAYEAETETAVTDAAQEHFSILQKTRDLAMSKIGMKWAWMEGVTYKDWQKYHQLKDRFKEWTEDLKRLITTNPSLVEAQTAGTDIEDEAMGIAAEAAAELIRLKQVAGLKAIAHDLSDNFDTDAMRLAAEEAEAKAAQEKAAREEAAREEAAREEAAREEAAREEAAQQKAAQEAASAEDAEDIPDSAKSSQDAHVDDEEINVESAVDAEEDADEGESINEVDSDHVPPARAPEETTSIKSAMFGAAAQSVPTRQPILDDLPDVPSLTSVAQSAYTNAIAQAANQYSSAMSAVSAQISGEPKPMHEEMFSSASSVYFEGMAAANSQLNEASKAASEGVYGTPTTNWMPDVPTMPSVDWERIQSVAQRNLDESVQWAAEQYEAAKVAVGAADPTPSTYLEEAEQRGSKILDQAKHNYYAGVGMAHARYSEFTNAASEALSSMTAEPTPTNVQESASSMASEASEAVGESWDSIMSRVSQQVYGAPTPTPWYADLYSAAGDYAASASDVAADQYSSASDAATAAGEAAASQYTIVSSLVSELIVGKEPDFTESVFSKLSLAYETGVSSASSLASAASETVASAASEATDKVKETVDQVKDEL